MSRSLVLGNGGILVCADRFGQVRDFYFPYVGLENQIPAQGVHKIGVWADGQFSWLDSGDWNIAIDTKEDALSGSVRASHKELELELSFHDVVYNEKNIFLRRIAISNRAMKKREIRLFLYHQFELYESHRGDTGFYDPREQVIVHYKGRRAILINAKTENSQMSDYAIGIFGIEGREGTYKDAEDGELSKNAIEHGRVDSVVSIRADVPGGKTATADYWITVAKSIAEAYELNRYVLTKTPAHLIKTTEDFWRAWITKWKFTFMGLEEPVVRLFRKSLLIIRSHVDNNGAIIASGDAEMLQYGRDTYSYMWPRDGAISALALDKAGDYNVAKRFFEFCNRIITREGYFLHKYRPDASLGSSWHPWVRGEHPELPIQEDGTALVLIALFQHYELSRDLEFIESVYNTLIKRAADFMVSYRDETTGLPRPSYDLWEEKFGVHTFTSSAVYGALSASAKFAGILGKDEHARVYNSAALRMRAGIIEHLYNKERRYFYRTISVDDNGVIIGRDGTIDASGVYGVVNFGVLSPHDPLVAEAIGVLEEKLCCHTHVGGLPRYEGDEYYRASPASPPNPWFITTLWLAQIYTTIAENERDLDRVKQWLNWCAKHALQTGILSEQIHPYSGKQLSAAPLTWSHSEFVITVIKYLEKLESLGICKQCTIR
ncbi:MAG: hypothetical protein A3C00_01650 [Candidatus Jacksonbacteria bacterium RIFCSPHIGHO2_02_FULL_44_25]|nr:MAG: hypothetical protein A3C00_01650 [Candidatus Jacksonbacteria bacterium RIFCSPHIGHO2_02_FULL_44_25]